MKVIVFSNQKGGVGKTTTCRELSIYLSEQNFKVLLIDADPQANLSKSLVDSLDYGLHEALTEQDYELEAVMPNLYLLAGNVKLAMLEKSLVGEMDAFQRLKDLLKSKRFIQSVLKALYADISPGIIEEIPDDRLTYTDDRGKTYISLDGEETTKGRSFEKIMGITHFDFILIDSPPSLGVLTGNALTASDWLIIPMNPSLYSMQGTNDLMATVAKVRKNFNPNLQLLGVIINAYDSNPVITRQIHGEIREAFGEKVFNTSLSKSIRIEEAIAAKTGVISRPRVDGRPSRAAEEIKAIGEELLNRLNLV
jgi:chromosome partitioning protein